MCFSSPKAPEPTPPPAPVDTTSIEGNQQATDAKAAAQKKAALAKGQGSTMLTSSLGDNTAAPVAKKSATLG